MSDTTPSSSSTPSPEDKRAELRRAALEYHELPVPGKISIAATKQMVNQRDLSLAYSPGVAAPCEEIVKDPANAFKYTADSCMSVSSQRTIDGDDCFTPKGGTMPPTQSIAFVFRIGIMRFAPS